MTVNYICVIQKKLDQQCDSFYRTVNWSISKLKGQLNIFGVCVFCLACNSVLFFCSCSSALQHLH